MDPSAVNQLNTTMQFSSFVIFCCAWWLRGFVIAVLSATIWFSILLFVCNLVLGTAAPAQTQIVVVVQQAGDARPRLTGSRRPT